MIVFLICRFFCLAHGMKIKLGEEMVLYLCIGMGVFIALMIINETEVLFHKTFTVIRAARISEMSAILENQEKHLHLLLTNDEDRFFFTWLNS